CTESFNTVRQFEDRTLIVLVDDCTLVYRTNCEDSLECIPWIFFHVLMAQCKSAVSSVKLKHLYIHRFANFHELRRMFDLLRPAQVRHVYKSVDTFFKLDEQAEVCQVTNDTFMSCTNSILAEYILSCPGIFSKLLDAQ